MQRTNPLLNYKLHHLAFWMLIFGVWYYLRYQDYATTTIAFQITLLKVTALAIVVYITNLLLVPRLLYKRKYFFAIAAFILIILAGSAIKVFIMSKILGQAELFSLAGNFKARFYENVISDLFLVLTGAAFKLMFDYLKMQRRLADIAKEKAETELNFLKSQINPHFLFNSLNSVYFLIDKANPEARKALHKFSEMLRYQLYEMNGEKIPVEKEIHYIQDYIDLQKLRKDDKYFVQFECSEEVKGFSIEPLLLIPFVENAFKHLSHYSDRMNFVKLNMDRNNGEFRFSVENSKESRQDPIEMKGGIGLNNVKRRLELLYPEKHELRINETGELYTVELKLKI